MNSAPNMNMKPVNILVRLAACINPRCGRLMSGVIALMFLGASYGDTCGMTIDRTRLLPGETIAIPLDTDAGSYNLEMSVAVSGNRNVQGTGNVAWKVAWLNADSVRIRELTVRWGNEYLGDPFDRRYMLVEIDSITPEGSRANLSEQRLYDGVNMFNGHNCLVIENTPSAMKAWIGEDTQYFAGACAPLKDAIGIEAGGNRKSDIKYAVSRFFPDKGKHLTTGLTLSDIKAMVESAASPGGTVGFWRFLDRDTDLRWADTGGVYTLAVVPHSGDICRDFEIPEDYDVTGAPVYDILYIGGAKVNPDRWKCGMIKGVMFSTIFENHYNLLWFDADMEHMGIEVTADVSDGAILTLNFPLYHSKIRFSKERILTDGDKR